MSKYAAPCVVILEIAPRTSSIGGDVGGGIFSMSRPWTSEKQNNVAAKVENKNLRKLTRRLPGFSVYFFCQFIPSVLQLG